MMKSFSKGLTKEITDWTAMIANCLVFVTKRVSNRLLTRKWLSKNPSIVRYK